MSTEKVKHPFELGDFRAGLEHVLIHARKIHRALDNDSSLEDIPGWRELAAKPRQMITHQKKPCLVSVLYGPSGAGKSTLFHLVTGLDVPRGETRRPMTRNCVVALPKALQDNVDPQNIFPGFVLHSLQDPAELRNIDTPSAHVFYAYYDSGGSSEAWLVLADAPDISTVERENWHRAKKMLERAETVIFVVHPESYKDEAVVSHLSHCCRYAGHLAYVLTKLPLEDSRNVARDIWSDLLGYARDAPRFQQRRRDGRTLHAVLENASVYFSPRTPSVAITDIMPLEPHIPEFRSLLGGRYASAIYWSSLQEAVDEGLSSVAMIAQRALARKQELKRNLGLAEERIQRAGEHIAGTQFPAGELVETIIETVKQTRPGWLRALTLPLVTAAGLFSSTGKLLCRLRGKNRGQILKDRKMLDKERLAEAVESLISQWRSDFPAEAAGMLRTDNCRRAAEAFEQIQVPEAQSEWKESLRRDIQDWARENRRYGLVLGTLSELLVLLGGSALVLDLALSGGLAHLGVGAAAAAGSVGAGTLLKLFEELKMKDILEKADQQWRAQRAREMAVHLRKHFAGPLFCDAWRQKMDAVAAAEPEICLQACADLRAQWAAHP